MNPDYGHDYDAGEFYPHPDYPHSGNYVEGYPPGQPQYLNYGMPQAMPFRMPGHIAVSGRSSSPDPWQLQRGQSPALSSSISYATSTTTGSKDVSEKKTRGPRVNWGVEETRVLLGVWGSKFAKLKGASNANKTKYWNAIAAEFATECRKRNVDTKERTLDKLKKRVSNLESQYRTIRTNMAATGQEGAKKIKGDFCFFDDLDEILGCRDAANPELMSIESTSLVPSPPSSHSPESPLPTDSTRDDEGDESDEGTSTETTTSGATDGKGQKRKTAAPAPNAPQEDQENPASKNPLAKSGGDKGKASKRKRRSLSKRDPAVSDEDPFMARICGIWTESLAKQEQRFSRSMELQEKAIESQTEQTKVLVNGLKDMLKEIMK